ncbi:MAG: transposase [Halobacteriovoraceae bacterium]|nr:transposase [Halobacteriovoraceae bacterium]
MRLEKYENSILLFAKMAEVDPTNNRAERYLRMSKVKKKVSGCFRSHEYAVHFCRIMSYVKTMKNKGYFSLQAITMALKGEIPK